MWPNRKTLKLRLAAAGQAALDFVSPPTCVLCRKAEHWLCRACQLALGERPDLVCPGCDGNSDNGLACELCKKLESPLDQLISGFPYESRSFHAALAAFKEDGCREIAPLLSRRLSTRCVELISTGSKNDWVIVPIPASRERRLKHGFNQSALIAEQLARKLDLAIATSTLQKQKIKKAQKELNVIERRLALKNAFTVRPVTTPNIILVDDVATTLATLETCATLLKSAGARRVIGAVLAHA
jgi:ComF family protein